MKIDIKKYRGNSSPSFTGRPEGESARRDAKLDKLDKDKEKYLVEIPIGTTAFNPSFFLGFFYDSIKIMGIEKFESKYEIVVLEEDQKLKEHLEIDISEGKRHALNQLNSKGGGLLKFLKRK